MALSNTEEQNTLVFLDRNTWVYNLPNMPIVTYVDSNTKYMDPQVQL